MILVVTNDIKANRPLSRADVHFLAGLEQFQLHNRGTLQEIPLAVTPWIFGGGSSAAESNEISACHNDAMWAYYIWDACLSVQ